MGPYAGVDYNRLRQMYQGQPYAGLDLNPMPESTLSPSQGLWIWPLGVERLKKETLDYRHD